MAITTKESAPSPSAAQAGTPAGQSAGTQASQRTDAIGIEIPVVVYASRNSAAGRGLSKAPPPVREETRTVIVFAQGAVVRLSANISAGEMVVLTNQQTGADVLCRVGAVKTQPGIQNYVDLEFTQRAPGFWDKASAAGPFVQTEHPASEPAVRDIPAAPAMPALQQQPVWPSSPASEPVSPVAAARAGTDHAATAGPIRPMALESPLSSPARPIAPSASNAVPGASATPRLAHPGPSTLTGDRLDWSKQAAAPPASKKGLWIGIAAVAVAGILAGGFFLSRRGQSSSPETGVIVAAPSAPVQPATTAQANEPQAPVAADPAPTAAAVPVQPPTWLPDKPRHDEQLQAANVPPPSQQAPSAPPAQTAPRRAAMPVAGIATPRAKGPIMVSSSEPPPVLITQDDGTAGGILRAGEFSGVSRVEAPTAFASAENSPAQPARPVAVGGKLEMPKLLSSVDPQYPAMARSQSLEGVVVLDALVDATGKVADVKVVSGPILLRQAAVDALRKWKYQPARLNGQPTAVHTTVNIRFATH